MPEARNLPRSVGFAVVEMIHAGFLDDCLAAIGAHVMMRQTRLAETRADTERRVAEILAKGNQ